MAIFNSYVKLPEGNIHTMDIPWALPALPPENTELPTNAPRMLPKTAFPISRPCESEMSGKCKYTRPQFVDIAIENYG